MPRKFVTINISNAFKNTGFCCTYRLRKKKINTNGAVYDYEAHSVPNL